MAQPFKIEKLGFYKMRNGEKCEVVHMLHDKCCDIRAGLYGSHLLTGEHTGYMDDYYIIAEWKEPRIVHVPEVVHYYRPLSKDVVTYTGDDCAIDAYKHMEVIESERVSAQHVPVVG